MVEKNTNPKLAGCEETFFNKKKICVHLNLLAGLAIHRQTQGRRQ